MCLADLFRIAKSVRRFNIIRYSVPTRIWNYPDTISGQLDLHSPKTGTAIYVIIINVFVYFAKSVLKYFII